MQIYSSCCKPCRKSSGARPSKSKSPSHVCSKSAYNINIEQSPTLETSSNDLYYECLKSTNVNADTKRERLILFIVYVLSIILDVVIMYYSN